MKAITAGWGFTCSIASDDNAYCWGYNYDGELGNNSDTNSLAPVAVDTSGVLSGKNIKLIDAGESATCAIASDDKVYCWGESYLLGNNSEEDSLVPVAVDTSGVLSGKTIKSVTVGQSQVCAIASDNQAYCWGLNSFGNLGNFSYDDSLVPVAVYTSGALSDKTVISISAGFDHTCVIASDNQAYCWGYDGYWQGGREFDPINLVPVAADKFTQLPPG